jgi:hypothetical protein
VGWRRVSWDWENAEASVLAEDRSTICDSSRSNAFLFALQSLKIFGGLAQTGMFAPLRLATQAFSGCMVTC